MLLLGLPDRLFVCVHDVDSVVLDVEVPVNDCDWLFDCVTLAEPLCDEERDPVTLRVNVTEDDGVGLGDAAWLGLSV